MNLLQLQRNHIFFQPSTKTISVFLFLKLTNQTPQHACNYLNRTKSSLSHFHPQILGMYDVAHLAESAQSLARYNPNSQIHRWLEVINDIEELETTQEFTTLSSLVDSLALTLLSYSFLHSTTTLTLIYHAHG